MAGRVGTRHANQISFSGGRKQGASVPLNSQSAECVSLSLEDSVGGLAFLIYVKLSGAAQDSVDVV